MAILTSIKDALNAKQYKSELEGLIKENKRLIHIKLTPTQMALSQILDKTNGLELELEGYDCQIETKTKAIEELENKSTQYNDLFETKSKEYEDLIELKTKELEDKSNEYEILIETKTKSIEEINFEYKNVKTSLDSLKSQIITLDDDVLMQSYGIYKPKYSLMNSEKCSTMLQDIREKQVEMIKSKEAIEFKQWIVDGSVKEGNELVDDMTDDMIKLVVRIFNDECDSIIDKVKFSNIEVIENIIKKFFEDLNRLGNITQVKIAPKYFNTKLEELYLSYEYKMKRQQEKEQQS